LEGALELLRELKEELENYLELLKKVRSLQELIEKFNEEHPTFVPIRYPEPFRPYWKPFEIDPYRSWNEFHVFCSDTEGHGERFW
jgi:hypothetical protein